MGFHAVVLRHGDRAPWDRITHVRLTGVRADTPQGQQVLNHIKQHEDEQGLAAIGPLVDQFPARKKREGLLRGMQIDLRHMANQREAGQSEQNKGLLELGWLE